MHRSITALIAAGLLLMAMAVPASAAKPEATGPACADIDVTANYLTDETTGPTVTFLFDLPLESCKQVTYSAYVYDATGSSLLASDFMTGDGGQIGFVFALADAPDTVCVRADSASNGGRVFDAAPDDAFCVELTLDAGGGAQKFG